MQYLFVFDRAPYGSWKDRELLDMAFSAAAFDQSVGLYFTRDGVNWLRDDQAPSVIDQKSVARHLGAAELFGLEGLFADQDSLDRFGLDEASITLPVSVVTDLTALESNETRIIRL
ncbi:tRNA 2-thiouridine synthesizing protein C [Tamilnaduibacter salinus]|uniref:Sulfur reduction protein DsrE n=1 Tax=Tamilnaduibacter salinus TaxID=1484056 RepID=A0A2A2I464_9GAMM|nr:DsrE family protein [Tamilnaduibacter salinus]PAV26382.1 sulfur reduction protein DsrE [Tamilnaduibacter salinus]PVY78197.1 tRNA 2-thiouridine synthesizing protein C [Tamilnaduibacter salinus]